MSRIRARAVYIVEYGDRGRKGPRHKLNSQTKETPIFPVETRFVEPTFVGTLPKARKKRVSTRALGTNPRAKGTNPRNNNG